MDLGAYRLELFQVWSCIAVSLSDLYDSRIKNLVLLDKLALVLLDELADVVFYLITLQIRYSHVSVNKRIFLPPNFESKNKNFNFGVGELRKKNQKIR